MGEVRRGTMQKGKGARIEGKLKMEVKCFLKMWGKWVVVVGFEGNRILN